MSCPWSGDDSSGAPFNTPTAAEVEIMANKSCEIGALGLYRDLAGRLALVGVLNAGKPIVIQKRSGGRVVGHVEVVRAARFGGKLLVGGYLEDATPTNGALVTVRVAPVYGASV